MRHQTYADNSKGTPPLRWSRPGLLVAVLSLLLAPTVYAQSGAVLIEVERLLRSQRLPDAIRVLNEHARSQSDAETQVFLMLSQAYRANGNAMMAMDACLEGERRYPDSALIAKCVARLLLARNPSLSATERYLRIATKNVTDRDAEAHYLFAQWACTNHRDETCVEQARIARELSGKNSAAVMQLSTLLGIAYDRQNNEEAAATAFADAFVVNQGLPVFDFLTAYEYVRFLTHRNRNDEALKVNEFILAKAPHFAPALWERAKLQARGGDVAASTATAEQALTKAGPDRELERIIRSHLASSYLVLGQTEKANEQQQWLQQH